MGVEQVAPRTLRGERTATRLRRAARAVFASQGYAVARVEDVVAEAGVSHGTFYTYYANKAAVLDALIDDTATALREVLAEPWEGPDVAATVEAVIGRFLEVFLEHADVVRVWLDASAHEPHFRDRLREVRTGYVRRVADNLAPALGHTPHDPTVAAAALVAMVEGYATQGLGGRGEGEAAVSTLAAIWYGGLTRLIEDHGGS